MEEFFHFPWKETRTPELEKFHPRCISGFLTFSPKEYDRRETRFPRGIPSHRTISYSRSKVLDGKPFDDTREFTVSKNITREKHNQVPSLYRNSIDPLYTEIRRLVRFLDIRRNELRRNSGEGWILHPSTPTRELEGVRSPAPNPLYNRYPNLPEDVGTGIGDREWTSPPVSCVF